ncbi:MAG: FAD-dependent oxidoreductase [Ruminococcaceae bacterium]|nr:FAD-dependent oxidoreductase [Oscillospiraceae bacterium]
MNFSDIEPIYSGKYDVIVVGGGIAGISAAVSAARNGAKTLLIEKGMNLGGLATSGLISWYEPLCDGEGKQMVYGISEELIKLATKYCFDNLPAKWGGSGKNKNHKDRYCTRFSPTVFSLALDEYVLESGAKIRFDSRATYPVMEGNVCKGVIVESASGREFFESKCVIDASGDACIMHRSGVPTVDGENYMTYITHMYNLDDAKNLAETGNTCDFRRWEGKGSDMEGNGHPEGMKMLKGVTGDDVTEYILIGKKRMFDYVKTLDKNSFDIMTLPTMPQFRTIRRIIGKCDFNAIDGETFADSIGSCGDFRPKGIGKHYQIPFGALYNEAFPNLLAAGRIISAPKGDGWEVSRVIPNCALTGEAAGKAAAKLALNGTPFGECY